MTFPMSLYDKKTLKIVKEKFSQNNKAIFSRNEYLRCADLLGLLETRKFLMVTRTMGTEAICVLKENFDIISEWIKNENRKAWRPTLVNCIWGAGGTVAGAVIAEIIRSKCF